MTSRLNKNKRHFGNNLVLIHTLRDSQGSLFVLNSRKEGFRQYLSFLLLNEMANGSTGRML